MNLNQMHHVAIIVSNYIRSKEFYVDKLGFEILRENFRADKGDVKLDLKFGECELELFAPDPIAVEKGLLAESKLPPKRPNYPEACGLRHLAFKVENIEAAVKELNEKGIEVESIRWDTFTGKKMTFFHDPDGLPLELHE